jgi:endonuclease-3
MAAAKTARRKTTAAKTARRKTPRTRTAGAERKTAKQTASRAAKKKTSNPPAALPAPTADEKRRAGVILRRLAKAYPDSECALRHRNPLELLVATILSAQCTDERVNIVTKDLFRKYPTAEHFASVTPAALEEDIRSTGFFRNKAKSIRGAARMLVDDHGGEVPASMDELVRLPGVARKTANVVLGTAFGKATGVVVDTHVQRISRLLGLADHRDPNKVEARLMELLPRKHWVSFSYRVIDHGRQVCIARRPRCEECPLLDLCPSAEI